MFNINTNILFGYLKELFPEDKALPWDNVGFQIEEVYNEQSSDIVKGIVVCLDITNEVIKFAIKNNANFIISRHPFIFNGDININENWKKDILIDYKKEIIKLAIKNSIQFYSIHTNYDWSINQGLVQLIKNTLDTRKIAKIDNDAYAFSVDLLTKQSLKDVVLKLKKVFKSENVQVSENFDGKKMIKNFIIGTGAGGSLMIENRLRNNVFITGEVKWHEWIYAHQSNVELISFGHYMENYFVSDIKNKIQIQFNNQIQIFEFDIKNKYKTF